VSNRSAVTAMTSFGVREAFLYGVPICHVALTLLFRALKICPDLSKKGSRGSDILAFSIVASLCVAYFSIVGFIGYFGLSPLVDNLDGINENRLYATSTYVVDYIVFPMLCYQTWNFFVCSYFKDFRTPDALGHHIVTGMLAYFGYDPFAQYYALFYFGIAEVSSIPLTLMDGFKFVPALARDYPSMNAACKYTFVLSFFIVRIFIWPFVSYGLFFNCVDVLMSGEAHSTFVVCYFLFANLFLTGLQFYWAILMIMKIMGSGKKSKKQN
jgi:hypothetical protein